MPRFPATPEDLHRAERRVRDLDWNPQRFPSRRTAPRPGRRKGPADRGRADREGRAAAPWFRQLQRVTRELRPAVADRVETSLHAVDRLRAELAANDVLASREYGWPLFPEAVLRNCFAQHL